MPLVAGWPDMVAKMQYATARTERESVSADCTKCSRFSGNNQIPLYRYKSNWQKALKGIKRGLAGVVRGICKNQITRTWEIADIREP